MTFAAGLGTRMRPLTNALPKPLIEVGGRALIDHALDRLAAAGVDRAIVNVHYMASSVEAHLRGRERPEIAIQDERETLLDQGGAIRRALPAIGAAPFLVVNTDAIWIEGPHDNLRRLVDAFDPARMDALLLVASTPDAIGVDWPGDFQFEADGRLRKRAEGEIAPFVYAGVGVMKPESFAGETRETFRLAPYFFDMAARGRLHGLRLDGRWLHVGTPQAVAEAERALGRRAP
ncbi:MAG: nucleotidyltransferase family protein [Hyphomicrobiales bacterium]|nr:nucleotidyltransferase family protein [Hyphomicrobiales bacterium]